MASHFFFLVLFAVMVSTVFAVLQKDTPRDQVRLAASMPQASRSSSGTPSHACSSSTSNSQRSRARR